MVKSQLSQSDRLLLQDTTYNVKLCSIYRLDKNVPMDKYVCTYVVRGT